MTFISLVDPCDETCVDINDYTLQRQNIRKNKINHKKKFKYIFSVFKSILNVLNIASFYKFQ